MLTAVANDAPRQPLANPESEAALLGAMMIINSIIDRVADSLTAEDFSEPLNGRIFSAIVRDHSLGRPANPITLRPYFTEDAAMAELGGPGFLGKLTGSGAQPIGWQGFVDQIRDLSARRRLVDGMRAAIDRAHDWDESIEAVTSEADAALVAATVKGSGIHEPTAAQCIDEVLKDIDNGSPAGVTSSISSLDHVMGSLRPKQLAIVAARPGMGKTAVALSYAIGAAQKGHGVLFVSLEMSSTELGARMAADLCFTGQRGVPFPAIIAGKLNGEDYRRVSAAMEQASELPFRVIDVGSVQIGRLNMMVRRHARRFAAAGQKLELVIVDYLQLVRPDQHMKSQYEAVSEVSRGLKQISKEHGVAVMALAQLSREVEKRPDKRPHLSDLRDSGQIEQDADVVMFLLREEYYLRKSEPHEGHADRAGWESSMAAAQHKIEFIVAKRRNGPDGRSEGQFYGQYQAVRG